MDALKISQLSLLAPMFVLEVQFKSTERRCKRRFQKILPNYVLIHALAVCLLSSRRFSHML